MVAEFLNDQTWIVSDTHFFHINIGRYCDRTEGWQETIIQNWNRFIKPEEVAFHVGDLALGKKEYLGGLSAPAHRSAISDARQP